MTLAVPEELRKLMRKHPEVKWSEVARQAMWEYARKLEIMDAATKGSRLTEDDVFEIDRVIKAGLARHEKTSGRTSD